MIPLTKMFVAGGQLPISHADNIREPQIVMLKPSPPRKGDEMNVLSS